MQCAIQHATYNCLGECSKARSALTTVLYKEKEKPSENNKVETHTHPFNGPFSVTTRVGQYQKGKTNMDFTEARDSE